MSIAWPSCIRAFFLSFRNVLLFSHLIFWEKGGGPLGKRRAHKGQAHRGLDWLACHCPSIHDAALAAWPCASEKDNEKARARAGPSVDFERSKKKEGEAKESRLDSWLRAGQGIASAYVCMYVCMRVCCRSVRQHTCRRPGCQTHRGTRPRHKIAHKKEDMSGDRKGKCCRMAWDNGFRAISDGRAPTPRRGPQRDILLVAQ